MAVSSSVKNVFCFTVFPSALLVSCIIRPSFISLCYGILLLLIPWFPTYGGSSSSGPTNRFLLVSLVVTACGLLAQIAFQIAAKVDSEMFANCRSNDVVLRQFGLEPVKNMSLQNAIRILMSDIVAFVCTLVTFIICAVLKASPAPPPLSLTDNVEDEQVTLESKNRRTAIGRLLARRLSDTAAVLLLGLVAIIHPSLLATPYFVLFLALMTWWACYKYVGGKVFTILKLIVAVYVALHLILLYIYQMDGLQRSIDSSSLTARLVGLTVLIDSNCTVPGRLIFNREQIWPAFVNPILLFLYYIYLAIQFNCFSKRYLRTGNRGTSSVGDDHSSVHEELLPDADDSPRSAQAKNAHQKRDFNRMLSVGTVPLDRNEAKRLSSFFGFFINHSYVLALLTMMAWAITYHSWLTFVFLALACLIWMLPDSRKACFYLSPFIVAYAEVLLLIQYIYGYQLKENELPDTLPEGPDYVLRQIGFIRYTTVPAFVPLLVKIGYSIPFFLTMRLFMRERKCLKGSSDRDGNSASYGTFQAQTATDLLSSQSSLAFWSWSNRLMAKYWIYVCALVILLVAILGEKVVAYSIIYMVFFALMITLLLVNWTVWRMTLFIYWMVLVVFSVIVLILVYTYQFQGVPEIWASFTHLSKPVMQSLGLEVYEVRRLVRELLTPLAFVIVVVLQLKFFHTPFMALTKMQQNSTQDNASPPHSPSSSRGPTRFTIWLNRVSAWWDHTVDILWRFAEIHYPKLVVFSFIMLAAYEVCAINFLFPLLIVFMVVLPYVHQLMCVIGSLWCAAICVVKMLYQMEFVPSDIADKNCSMETRNGTFEPQTNNAAVWAGFAKLASPGPIGAYLKGYVCVLVVLAFQAIVNHRQRHHRLQTGELVTPGVLFPDIGRNQADHGLLEMAKYLLNYGFYKFGVELSFITCVLVIGIRMDGVAVLYGVWMLVMLSMRRKCLSGVWLIWVCFLAVMLLIQYASCIGLPPSECIHYDPQFAPNAKYLIADFFLLLFSSCQLHVFRIEWGPLAESYSGGSNAEIVYQSADDESLQTRDNPIPDYITYTKSYLDMAKVFIYLYLHWITMLVVFIAGVSGISLFALGYLLSCFLMLWRGNALFLKKLPSVIRMWTALLFYAGAVIVLKASLQVLGCAYAAEMQSEQMYCVLTQLFSVICLQQYTNKLSPPDNKDDPTVAVGTCTVNPAEAHVAFDVAAFAFIVIQLRIFGSYYFEHVIKEFIAQKMLSSCGAELVNRLMRREIRQQKDNEDSILSKIIGKMARLKEQRQKAAAEAGVAISDADNYADAKASGDYYMVQHGDDFHLEPPLELQQPSPEGAPEVQLGADTEPEAPAQVLMQQLDSDFRTRSEATSPTTSAVARPVTTTDSNMGSADQTDAAATQGEQSAEIKEEKPGLVVRFLSSFLNYLTWWCNMWSRNYRYVAYVLNAEKLRIKTEMHERPNLSMAQYTESSLRAANSFMMRTRSAEGIEQLEQEVNEFSKQHNVGMRFLIAAYYLAVSKTEFLCYIFIIVDQMVNASVISLPLPLLTFCWGILCAPRPPRIFWVTLITYTEAMVIVKFIFQFNLFPWNDPLEKAKVPNNKWDYPQRILGIEQVDYYAVMDIVLLFGLFYHRYMLRNMGLWKDVRVDDDVDATGVTDMSAASSQSLVGKEPGSFELQALESNANGQQKSQVDRDPPSADQDASAQDRRQTRLTGCKAYVHTFSSFVSSLRRPTRWYRMDLYSLMFFLDFICFLILVFGYASFGTAVGEEENVANMLSQNKVPLPFILMVLAQFALIVIDRALYLRHQQTGKIIFHYFVILVIHAWLFFLLPLVTQKRFTQNPAAKVWYFFKCIYMIVSAWQIRAGYPTRILGNFLTKSYGMVNYCLFKGFMAVPFLFEMRTLMDWIWTDTCMPMFDWFKMENIYAYVYSLKCSRKMAKDYPFPVGVPRGLIIKYLMGFSILLLLFLIIWLPLLLFSLLSRIGTRELPTSCSVKLELYGYPPLFTMTAQESYLEPLSALPKDAYSDMIATLQQSKVGSTYLSEYDADDILRVVIRRDSVSPWLITEPARQQLMLELANGSASSVMTLSFSWEFYRPAKGSDSAVVISGEQTMKLRARDPVRLNLADVLDNSTPRMNLTIPQLFFPFVEIPPTGNAAIAKSILSAVRTNMSCSAKTPECAYVNVTLGYSKRVNESSWWTLTLEEGEASNEFGHWIPPSSDTDGIAMIAFVSKVFPALLNAVVKNGIIGAYIVVVLAIGRVLRGLLIGNVYEIMYDELPDVDRLLQLCLDIFLVREAKDFKLEIELFGKLLFLFRSPATLIEWTKPKRD